jgi:putative FmdB family regulatory protein
MPTYEYFCEKCGHSFELFQSMTASPLTVCPQEQCPKKRWGRGKVRRAIGGGAGLIFKGSGFYITDYRSENYKSSVQKESGAGKEAKSGDGKSSAPKTETKPAKSDSSSSATT